MSVPQPDHDYPPAAWLPTTHCWPGQNRPRYVILHGTGYLLSQTAADVAHDFATTNPNSAHYAVGRAGDVAQMVREADAAWANGVVQPGADPWWTDNPNRYTISIEHVNDAQNASPLTESQRDASFALIADICRRVGIPARPADAAGGIAGHASITPVTRAHCPGAYPWDALWAYLGGHAMSWTAPGAEAISEFARQASGVYLHATCVETAALMCLIAQDPAARVPSAQIGDYLARMVADWQAWDPGGVSSQGASSYVDATHWLRGKGLTVDEDVMSGAWWDELVNGIAGEHNVYLVGVTNAQAFPGDEPGVFDHGFCAYGYDGAGGVVCGDPDNAKAQVNMPGNPVGLSVVYHRQDFVNGQISSLTRVHPMAGIPAGWSDDGLTLWAPNHVPVVKGFRAHILSSYWRPEDWPIGPEASRTPVERSNLAIGGGSVQTFRKSRLEWSPTWNQGNVFESWLGQELVYDEKALGVA